MKVLPVPHLPTVEAIGVAERRPAGRSVPLAMHCAEPDGSLSDYIVKLYGDFELGRRALARELYCALLGQVLGLPVPRAVVVNVLPELYRTALAPDIRAKLERSPGLNFGSLWMATGQFAFRDVPKDHLPLAGAIFAFDVIIHNPDRQTRNPNLLQHDGGFTIFDHEMALQFAAPHMLVGGVPEPWDLRSLGDGVKHHVLLSSLKGSQVSFDGFFNRLSKLTDGVLVTIEERIPAEWRTEELEHIRTYLNRSRDSAAKVKRSLQEAIT